MNTKINQKSDTQDQVTEALSNNSFDVKKYQKFSIYEGVLMSIFAIWLGGFVITGYERYLGFNSSLIGLVSGSMLIARSIGMLIHSTLKKHNSIKSATIWTRMWAMAILNILLLLPLPALAPIRFVLFWSIITLQAVFASISTSFWYVWWTAAIPPNERTAFTFKRHLISNVATVLVTLLTAPLLDKIPAPLNFLLFIGFGTLIGQLSTLFLQKQPEVVCQYESTLTVVDAHEFVLFNPKFKNLGKFALVFSFSFMLVGSFFFLHLLKDLNFSFSQCGIWMIIGHQSAIYFTGRWSYLASRFGTKNVVLVCLIIAAVSLTLASIFATPTFSLPIYIASVIEGGCGAVVASLYLDLAYKQANNKEKNHIYVAFSVLMGIGGGIGSIVGGFLLDFLSNIHLPIILGRQLMPFDVLVLLGSLIRLISLAPLIGHRGPPQAKFREILPYLLPTLLFFWKKPEFVEAIEEKKDDSPDISKEDK